MRYDYEKLTPPELVNSKCVECGTEVPEEFQTCGEFFLSILEKTRQQVGPYSLTRLLIDTFGMQHPKRSCKSAKSYAAHLTGLCCGLEYDGAKTVYAAIQRWLNGPVEAIGITRPQEPEYRGKLTIRYIYDAEAEIEYRLYEWAKDVWEAYSSQHKIARNWIKEAIKK